MEEQPTKWSILASGEGANKIAFLYYAKMHNPAIGDRVLLLNTTPADVKPEQTFEYTLSKDPALKEIFDKVSREKICIFGKSPSGAGNNWKVGEKEAREDFDTVRRYIANLGLREGDVLLGISTLGGGTGNGSLPYLINELKYGESMISGGQNKYMALGILPYDFEGPQRHFNTVCGITRLLKFGEKGSQNADIVILVDNSQIEKMVDIQRGGAEERYYLINQEVIKAINMMISPGGRDAKYTIDIADYYQLPGNIGVYHFTPCLSLDNDPEIIGIETALESAMHSPMVPVDVKTATMVYVIVVAPQKYVEDKTFTQEGLEDAVRDWAVKNMAGNRGGILRYSSLVSSRQQETFDVILLLGGFSLNKIIAKSLQKYYDFKSSLKQIKDEIEIKDQDNPMIRVRIGIDDINIIEKRIREYISETEEKIKIAKSGELDLKEKMKEWGFEGSDRPL